jgi:hypothetical protein
MQSMGRPSRYPQQLKERAVRMVFEHAHEHPSQVGDMRTRSAPRPDVQLHLSGG